MMPLCSTAVTTGFDFSSENGSEGQVQVRYDVMEVPITLPFQKPPADKPNPKQGISKLCISFITTFFNLKKLSLPVN